MEEEEVVDDESDPNHVVVVEGRTKERGFSN